jgi:hypothetical protein
LEDKDLLRYAVEALERLGLRYLVTGSMATIFFGEPRFTNDIDIVVDLPSERIGEFCAAFPPEEFYLSEETVRRAVRNRGQLNIIHPSSGLKIDIMIPADTLFDRSRFERAHRVRPEPDFDASFASPEDVIVKKLEYYREGGSEKHLRDITGVLRISGEKIDRSYIKEWAERLGLEDIWQMILERLEPARSDPERADPPIFNEP